MAPASPRLASAAEAHSPPYAAPNFSPKFEAAKQISLTAEVRARK